MAEIDHSPHKRCNKIVNRTDAEKQYVVVKNVSATGYGRVQSWGFFASALFSWEAAKTCGVVSISEMYLRPGGAAGTLTSGLGPEAAMLSTNYKYIQNMSTL